MIGKVGERLVIGPLQLVSRTHYQARFRDQEGTVWRHSFRTATGERVVYSGKFLNIEPGSHCFLKATIHRHEFGWRCTRVKRPRIIPHEESPMKF